MRQIIRDIEISKVIGDLDGDALKIVNFFNNLFSEISYKTLENDTSLYLVVGDKFYFKIEQDVENGFMWCKYDGLWSYFETEYQYNYEEIQSLMKYMVEEQLKSRVGAPYKGLVIGPTVVEEQLKSRVGAPLGYSESQPKLVEEQLKSRVGTPSILNRFWSDRVDNSIRR